MYAWLTHEKKSYGSHYSFFVCVIYEYYEFYGFSRSVVKQPFRVLQKWVGNTWKAWKGRFEMQRLNVRHIEFYVKQLKSNEPQSTFNIGFNLNLFSGFVASKCLFNLLIYMSKISTKSQKAFCGSIPSKLFGCLSWSFQCQLAKNILFFRIKSILQ